MIHQGILVRHEPTVRPYRPLRDDAIVHRHEILRVLERAAADAGFIAQLTHRQNEALEGYNLTWRERAALLSGDIRWIEAHIGALSPRLRTWLECRLQQEKW
jgi:hypothetical protein